MVSKTPEPFLKLIGSSPAKNNRCGRRCSVKTATVSRDKLYEILRKQLHFVIQNGTPMNRQSMQTAISHVYDLCRQELLGRKKSPKRRSGP